MEKKQIIVVGLAKHLEEMEQFLPEKTISLHLADDVGEGMDIVNLVGCDMLIADLDGGRIDPLEVVATAYSQSGDSRIPFVFVDLETREEAIVIWRQMGDDRFNVARPALSELRATIYGLLTSAETQTTLLDEELSVQISSIGFNDQVEVGGNRFLVQTEVYAEPETEEATIRCVVFDQGKIVTANTTPFEFSTNPVAETEDLAKKIHNEAIEDLTPGR